MTLKADPKILIAAEKLFKTRGYQAVLMADIAAEAKIALPAVQSHYHDKEDILYALLEKHSPREALQQALSELNHDTPEELVRDAIRRMLDVFEKHADFADLAILDLQVNNSNFTTALFSELAGGAAGFVNRLANMPGTRPISTIMLGRAFASLLIGFVATQYFAPRPAQFAMRIFPQRAWVDGVADVFLYGILESE